MLWDLKDPKNDNLKQWFQKRLDKKGLKLDINELVESCGPAPDMPYVYWILRTDQGYIVLYPDIIYWTINPVTVIGPQKQDIRIYHK